MKILHVAYCFHPDPVGGTEIYVESLAMWQRRKGLTVEIAAAAAEERSYTHDGVQVHRFAASSSPLDLRDLYGAGDPTATASFTRILDRSAPDVVHLHAWTSGVSLRLIRAVRATGVPVVFTYHTPAVSCVRGTLLRWGAELCDGELATSPCAGCTLHGKELSLRVSRMLGSLPPAVGEVLGKAGLSGGVWTAIRMSELLELRQAAFQGLLAEADHIVGVCEWVRDLLIRNGASPAKVTLSRQGLCEPINAGQPRRVQNTGDTRNIKIAFLGRVAPVKGIHVLIQAIRRLPEAPFQLDIYGVVQDEEGRRSLDAFSRLIAGDRRIKLLEPLASNKVVAALEGYDLLAVPSQWLETGPLVVYEAFAAGIPVLGSDLGGIAELVRHDHNGLLVEPASVDAWVLALKRLMDDPGLLARLRSAIPSVRTMEEAADEMLTIYAHLRRPQPALEPVASI